MRAAFFLSTLSLAYAVTHESNGTSIQVLGQSGKATITRNGKDITMQVDYLSEVDVAGNEVGKVGSSKHSVNSFATQSFTFSPLRDVAYQNVSAKEFTFETPIYDIGRLQLDTLLLGNDGSVGTETETWNVRPGDLKWNIRLSEWTFCNPCADGIAEFVDVGIEIKGQEETKSNTTVDLGSATLQLSNRVTVDGVERDMPSDYPKVVTKGSKQLYVFRFPTFQTSATYDPLLQMNTGSIPLPSTLISMLLILLAYFPTA